MERQGGKVEVEVKGARAQVVWKFLDFTAMDKVAPDIESCVIIDGVAGEPGCTRLLEGTPTIGPDGQLFVPTFNEKLLTVDHENMSFSYEVTESVFEFVGYTAQVQVFDDGEDSRILWSFEAESFGLWSRDGFLEFLQRNLRAVAKSIEDAVERGEA